MPNSGDTVYWDASVFLSYVNGEQERLPTIDALLEESRNGEFTIVTSTLSITEVAFAEMEKTQRALDPQVEQAIDALLVDRERGTPADAPCVDVRAIPEASGRHSSCYGRSAWRGRCAHLRRSDVGVHRPHRASDRAAVYYIAPAA